MRRIQLLIFPATSIWPKIVDQGETAEVTACIFVVDVQGEAAGLCKGNRFVNSRRLQVVPINETILLPTPARLQDQVGWDSVHPINPELHGFSESPKQNIGVKSGDF